MEQPPKTSAVNPETAKSDSEKLKQAFAAANEHRDYIIYTRSMDAALEAKAQSIFPHFEVNEGDIIVDAGSGTGKLAELAAREFRGAKVYALDISHELQERAEADQTLTHLVYGDAKEQNFPDNSVNIKYYSTVGHEIESFGGEGSMRIALANTFKELVPGGRVVIRDFAKPENKNPIYMRVLSNIGLDAPSPGTTPEKIDYSLLSASALLERFQLEFRDGGAFKYKALEINGKDYIEIDPEWACEFYLRKDYTANWRQEIKEKYTYWTMDEARQILEEAGYVNISIIPDPNEYILKNRLLGKIELYQMVNGDLKAMPFPTTHMIIIAEKPNDAHIQKLAAENVQFPAVNYKELLESINFDEEHMLVRVGNKEFRVKHGPLVGSKKNIFHLADENKVLKTARNDTRSAHAVFKSLFQTVERQKILKETGTPHLEISEADSEGPPYRYVIQETAPADSQSAAELITSGDLAEDDIKQISEIVNKFELAKEWQLDTNPFSWFRIRDQDGKTRMVYVSGKVYRYDEGWEFKKVGLLQWCFPEFVKSAQNFSAAIPNKKRVAEFAKLWSAGGGNIDIWKKHLHPSLWPE